VFGFLLHRPYLHLLVALCLGIALGEHWALPVALLVEDKLLLLGCILCQIGVWWLWRDDPSWKVLVPGFLAVILIGYVSASLAVRLPLVAPLRQYVQYEPVTLTGRVASMPKYQRGHLRFMLNVYAVGERVARRGNSLGACACFVQCEPDTRLYMTDTVRLTTVLEEAPYAMNYGQFDYRSYLLQRGTVLTAYAGSASSLRRISAGTPAPWGALSRLRLSLMRNLARRLPPDYAELAISVVYGDKITDLPPQLEERFRRAGLTHILVASGTQVSLLILLLAGLFCRVYTDFTWRSMLLNAGQFSLTLAVVLAYAALTGFETSIARALAMGVLVLVGRLVHREADGLTSLAQSGLILLILNPLALSSAGFLLSFGATLGLIYAAGVAFPLFTAWGRLARGAAQTLTTTSGAQLFVAPVLAHSFQQLSLWGLLSNLAAIPTAFALLITGGLCSLGLGAVPFIGQALNWVVFAFCWLLDWEARIFAALPGANLAVPPPPWWWITAYFALLLVCGEWIKNNHALAEQGRRLLTAGSIASVLLLATGVMAWLMVPRPELSALSLPGGEAYLWRPYTSRMYLLARSAGIMRSHNAETIANALRFRGVNKLSGIIWLDAPPQEDPLPDYPARSILAGGDLPAGSDMAWLVGGGGCIGARCALGRHEAWVLWADPEAGVLARTEGTAARGGHRPSAVLIGPKMTAAGVEAAMLASEAAVVLTGVRKAARKSIAAATMMAEVRILPGGNGVRQKRFRSPTP
jgi:ComEC/Rec2-related protein